MDGVCSCWSRGPAPGLGKLVVGREGTDPAAGTRAGPFSTGRFLPLQQSDSKHDSRLEDTSFVLEVESLRKTFLQRPDCPQFCTRATSMSHDGETCQRGPPPPPRRKTASVPGWTPRHLRGGPCCF